MDGIGTHRTKNPGGVTRAVDAGLADRSTTRSRRPPVRVTAVVMMLLATACSVDSMGASADLAGATVEVLAVWQGAEAAAFELVLDRFERDTGAEVSFTSTAGEDIVAVLDRRLAAGDPPDVAVLPQPGLLRRFADSHAIMPIDTLVGDEVRENWAPVWQRLGSVDGELYGLWFKAANKSLFWYSIAAFERAGVVPPDDLDGLASVVEALAGTGTPAFSVVGAPADAWTMTDWFENLYLRLAGPERYDALAERRLAWTDPSVETTLRAMGALLAPANVVVAAGSTTTFPESVAAVFSRAPMAAMVMEGDFVPGVVAGSTSAEIGVDVDVFPFPGDAPSDRFVVGGGDAAVLMLPSPGGEALLRYLASPEAGAVWAGLGGFVSPNESVELTAYPDATTRRIARSLLEAGDDLRFDLSDLQPVEFGGTTGGGLWAELDRFASDPTDVDGTMERLEAAAAAAWGED
jgi:alpha-glucoside transport system substrate-binding protein